MRLSAAAAPCTAPTTDPISDPPPPPPSNKRKAPQEPRVRAPARSARRARIPEVEWTGRLPRGTAVEVLFDAGEEHERWYPGSIEKWEMYWDRMQYCIHFADGDKRWLTQEQLDADVASNAARIL